MPACSRGGFIALAAFGDQAFDLPPFLSAVSIFLFDFTRHEKDALICDLEDHGGTLCQVEDIADGGGDGDLSLDVIVAISMISMKAPYILRFLQYLHLSNLSIA